jgi:hypothetical protein
MCRDSALAYGATGFAEDRHRYVTGLRSDQRVMLLRKQCRPALDTVHRTLIASAAEVLLRPKLDMKGSDI